LNRIWGLNPLGYHLTSILLHAVNTFLVVLIAGRLLGPRPGEKGNAFPARYLSPAALITAGLLFGIHPLRVDSVAWNSACKDVLNGVFSLGCVLWYLR